MIHLCDLPNRLLGLVFFFLVAMDRPFAGKESISPSPFTTAITSIDDWDAASKAAR